MLQGTLFKFSGSKEDMEVGKKDFRSRVREANGVNIITKFAYMHIYVN